MVYPMMYALAKNATIFAPTMGNWTLPSCSARDWTCYFSSLRSLTPGALNGYKGAIINLQIDVNQWFNESSYRDMISTRWTEHGRFWLISQILRWLTVPNPRLNAKLEAARQELGLVPPYLSLHVRAGDACNDRGNCMGLSSAMPQVETMLAKYHFESIYLATPDPRVINEIVQFPNMAIKARPTSNATRIMRERGIEKIDDAIAQGVLNAGDEWDGAMIDLYLLSEGHAMIGPFSSNAARVAYSLMSSGTSKCISPFISFDINWCSAFGKGGDAVLRIDDKPCSAYKSELPEYFTEKGPCSINC